MLKVLRGQKLLKRAGARLSGRPEEDRAGYVATACRAADYGLGHVRGGLVPVDEAVRVLPVAAATDQERQLVTDGAERLDRPGIRGAGDGEGGGGAVRVQLLQPGRTAGGGLGVRPARNVPGAEEGPLVT